MYCVTYTAFGKDLKEYTFLKEDDVEFALSMICPSYQNFKYIEASEEDHVKLSSPIILLSEKKMNLRGREVVRPQRTRKYRSQGFPEKHCYMRTHNISFFEDSLSRVAWHYPELGIFLK